MKSRSYYPVYLDLENVRCLVVGGGRIAERKIRSLLDSGAIVVVVSPKVTTGIRTMVDTGKIQWIEKRYTRNYLKSVSLVISATNDDSVNDKISRDAKDRNIPVNVVDEPARCSFIVPAVARSGDIHIAVSTGGGAPGMAGRIRDRLAEAIGPEYATMVAGLKARRDRIRALSPNAKEFFHKSVALLQPEAYSSNTEKLVDQIDTLLEEAERGSPHNE